LIKLVSFVGYPQIKFFADITERDTSILVPNDRIVEVVER